MPVGAKRRVTCPGFILAMLLQIVGLKGHEMTLYANKLHATPPFGSGSEAAIKRLSPSPSVGPLPILAALRRGSLHTPTKGDGDEAEQGINR
jgi:hypothetical protein